MDTFLASARASIDRLQHAGAHLFLSLPPYGDGAISTCKVIVCGPAVAVTRMVVGVVVVDVWKVNGVATGDTGRINVGGIVISSGWSVERFTVTGLVAPFTSRNCAIMFEPPVTD